MLANRGACTAAFFSAWPAFSGDIAITMRSTSSYRPGCSTAQLRYSSTVMRRLGTAAIVNMIRNRAADAQSPAAGTHEADTSRAGRRSEPAFSHMGQSRDRAIRPPFALNAKSGFFRATDDIDRG